MSENATIEPSYDVIVVGGGPAGSAAAVGYARQGAAVLLLEANPRASSRFAGEWIHPTGGDVLRKYGLFPHAATSKHTPCYGFAVFPDDGSEAVQLDYADGTVGFSCEHGDLVESLRSAAAATPGVTYLEHARVSGVAGEKVTFTHGGREHTIAAGRIIAADGRSSVVRKSLRQEDEAELISHMAGIELHGIEMPFEGYGHVLLGGPGAILLYRIAEDRVRACVDIPAGTPGARRDARYLWDAFASRFPETLRPAYKRALEQDKIIWASNRFLPRTFYGAGRVALVGDAVGFCHPLTATGITVALKDTDTLLSSATLEEYRQTREPQSYVSELLVNALFQVFMREDESAVAIRSAVFDTWRDEPAERVRTMRILAGDEVRLDQFGGAFVNVARRAVQDTTQQVVADKALRRLPHEIARFAEWAQWPGATLVPRRLREKWRRVGTRLHPLRGAGITPPAPALPSPTEGATPSVSVDVDALLARVTDAADLAPAEPASRLALELEGAVAQHRLADAVRLVPQLVEAAEATRNLGARRDAAVAMRRARARFPGLLPGVIDGAWARFADQLRRAQRSDGAFEGGLMGTALALELLHASGLPPFHPRLRRAVRVLVAGQREDGSFGGARTTAIVCRALLASEAPHWEAIERGLASLGESVALGAEASDALHLYRDKRATRVMPAKGRRAAKASSEDVAYCRESLLAVSRSFARPIEMLPGDLRTAVTCGYLLCRIADTIEDNAFFTVEERDARYETFLAALYASPDDEVVRRFEDQFRGVEGNQVENDLCQHLGTVLRVFRGLPKGMQTKATRWVAEMTRGMQLYSHRTAGDDGYTALYTVEDLERYCYFVAGTVGHMLTDLFVEAMGAAGTDTEHALRTEAEAFGVGLQLVNILKDITDDRERRVSFIPRTSANLQGLAIDALVDPAVRERAHAAVAPLFDTAQARLDRALEYVLAIPAEHGAMRLFCLLPLWMAVRTLVHARGNDAMFTAGNPVKIARAEVEELIADCLSNASKDEALRQRYDALWRMPALESSTHEATVH